MDEITRGEVFQQSMVTLGGPAHDATAKMLAVVALELEETKETLRVMTELIGREKP